MNIPKAYAYIQIMTKKNPAKFKKDQFTTEGGVVSTTYLLSEGGIREWWIRELWKAEYCIPLIPLAFLWKGGGQK